MKLTMTVTMIIKRTMSFIMKLMLNASRINIDNIMAGNVNKSPKAAIIGLVTLSGSHPRSKLLNEMNMVIGSIIRLDITPAITLIKMKSVKSIEWKLNSKHNPLATMAKNRDRINVKTNDENIL